MGVYIKGMDMPKYGDTFKVYLDADGAFLLVDTNDSSRFYTLVEVKAPHGRLIDADKARCTYMRSMDDDFGQFVPYDLVKFCPMCGRRLNDV